MSGDVDGRGRAGPHRPGRRRQHDQGHHQGHRHRHRRARGLGALRLVPDAIATAAKDVGEKVGDGGPMNLVLDISQPNNLVGLIARRRGRLPLLRARDQRGVAVRGCRGLRGAAAVPRAPRDHGLHARSRSTGASSTSAPRTRCASWPRPVCSPSSRRSRRLHARRRRARLVPRRRDRHRHPDGGLPRQLRRRVGQREEARRGRPLRRQGQRGPRRDRHRRHGRRPVQGHGRARRSTRC